VRSTLKHQKLVDFLKHVDDEGKNIFHISFKGALEATANLLTADEIKFMLKQEDKSGKNPWNQFLEDVDDSKYLNEVLRGLNRKLGDASLKTIVKQTNKFGQNELHIAAELYPQSILGSLKIAKTILDHNELIELLMGDDDRGRNIFHYISCLQLDAHEIKTMIRDVTDSLTFEEVKILMTQNDKFGYNPMQISLMNEKIHINKSPFYAEFESSAEFKQLCDTVSVDDRSILYMISLYGDVRTLSNYFSSINDKQEICDQILKVNQFNQNVIQVAVANNGRRFVEELLNFAESSM
jgi:hypothetical protein